jgi:hypothetical protein
MCKTVDYNVSELQFKLVCFSSNFYALFFFVSMFTLCREEVLSLCGTLMDFHSSNGVGPSLVVHTSLLKQ